MLSLTRKADYAVVALADLARRGASRASAREISETTRVPLPMLTNILHQLLHHGLVNSTLGSRGGYCLSRPPGEISLAELVDAIEGRFRLALCCGNETDCSDDPCDIEENCLVKEPIRRVHSSLRHFLDQVSLAHLAFNDVPVGLVVTASAHKDHQESV